VEKEPRAGGKEDFPKKHYLLRKKNLSAARAVLGGGNRLDEEKEVWEGAKGERGMGTSRNENGFLYGANARKPERRGEGIFVTRGSSDEDWGRSSG